MLYCASLQEEFSEWIQVLPLSHYFATRHSAVYQDIHNVVIGSGEVRHRPNMSCASTALETSEGEGHGRYGSNREY